MGFEQEALETLIASVEGSRSIMEERMARATKGEPFVLRQLLKQGFMTPSQLASAMKSSSGRISAVLSALEKKGMVTRAVDPQDRRNVIVNLTEAGREQALRNREEVRSAVCWVFTQMGERRTREFVELMEEFSTYVSICRPGGEEPSAQEVSEAFARRRAEREAGSAASDKPLDMGDCKG